MSWHWLHLHLHLLLHRWEVPELGRDGIKLVAWGIALAWCLRAYDALRYLPGMTNLTDFDWDVPPAKKLRLTVVVPARDEVANIAATLDALMLADYAEQVAELRVVAVDDRSTDGTGAVMDEYAKRQAVVSKDQGVVKRPRLDVIHITELPEGWLGKTFAMQMATERTAGVGESDYVLYTDADVLFSPSILRRAVAYAEASEADHLVVMPTLQVKSRGEGIVLGFFQILGLWASRPWKVEDPLARRDIIGAGAFNMVRRAALEELGGWAPQRLAVLEDITLGRRMKAAGMRQRIAFAPGLVLVHWAKGARGLMGVMTKNMFSAFNFRPLLLLGACVWIVVFCLSPLVGWMWLGTLVPSVVVLVSIGSMYRTMGEVSLIDDRYGWLYPLGAMAFLWALTRSMVTVMWQRGVVWRGTHYELRELRQHNSPFVWERAARKVREEQVQARKMVARAKRKSKG